MSRVEEFWKNKVIQLHNAIREHRDARGDDRCWQDDEALYRVLPEGYTPPARDTAVELQNCQRYVACRQNPATEYTSPEREIEQLRSKMAGAKNDVNQITSCYNSKYYDDCTLCENCIAALVRLNANFGGE